MKKEMIIKTILVGVVIIAIVIGVIYKNDNKKALKETKGITVVPTMYDEITTDTAWSPTFQLVWNDFKNELIKQDIVFEEKSKMVDNLNKEYFTDKMISEDYYYKKYGLKTLELKDEIEKGIKEKFNQTSDIINDFNWDEKNLNHDDESNSKRYFFYSMLYREFEYNYKFKELEKGSFKNAKDIKYFGTDEKSKGKVRSQITVLFYNNEQDFAISISTKNNDELIFYKNPKGTTFIEIYENLLNQKEKYKGSKSLSNEENFKAPYMDFKVKKEFTELENKPFKARDEDTCVIEKAMQSIEFQINEKGGKVKSEAGLDVVKTASGHITEIRHFNIDDTFALFLKENKKDIPYFAMRVNDITKYQQN